MMMVSEDFKVYLETIFPDTKFYIGALDNKSIKCIGIYPKSNDSAIVAIGGKENSSYNVLPIEILVHWTENASACEKKAREIYEALEYLANISMNGVNVRSVSLTDSSPINLNRDENNIAEMVIRLKIFYER